MNLKADGSIMHRNANLVHNDWETDAYLLAITFPEGADMKDPDAATRYFIADGSYLRWKDKVVLDSLSKVFMTATKQDSSLDVLLQGQPIINAFLHAPQQPAEVMLNRVKVNPDYNEKSRTIKFTLRNNDL